MIKTLNPYPNPAKTAEIMSRYRPIAPKPDTNSSNSTITSDASYNNNNNTLSPKIKQSPYLRNLWPQLQARPTRTRKRGRATLSVPPSSLKRHKTSSSSSSTTTTTHILGFCPPISSCHVTSPAKNLTLQLQPFTLPNHGLGLLNSQLQFENTNLLSTTNNITKNPNLVTLPLLPCSPSTTPLCSSSPLPKFEITTKIEETIELNLKTTSTIPEEKDLLQQLQRPTPTKNQSNSAIIAPQPIRPIGSCIIVGCINEDPTSLSQTQRKKRKEEVEDEVESESLPAIISDSKNRVRMANSAYKEMVGQPECPWLESMVKEKTFQQCGSSSSSSSPSSASSPCKSKRISGEITLHMCDSVIPVSSNGFSCWVRIEWQSNSDDEEEIEKNNKNKNNNKKKFCVNAFCDVNKLCCESKDYVFTWRFHTRTREASQSSCNV